MDRNDRCESKDDAQGAVDRRQPVATQIGEVRGRDAIYVDRVTHTFSPSVLQFVGELNAYLCTGYKGPHRWLAYGLELVDVGAYSCWTIERYPDELLLKSSLDIVVCSTWLERVCLPQYTHYVIATYDYVYEVAAKGLELRLFEERSR